MTRADLRRTRGGARRDFGGEDVGDAVWEDLGLPEVQGVRESA